MGYAHGSAQEFIRALKASSDPPHPGGASKVEFAREAWDDTAFYLPNKGEVIVDWLLTRLLKDKAKERDVNPILDTRYWQLLSDILSSSDAGSAKPISTARSIKSWILPVLNRTPTAPIVVAFFSLTASATRDTKLALNPLVSQCLAVLWPLAVPRFTPEILLECFGAVLAYLVQTRSDDIVDVENLAGQTMLLVVSSYKIGFGNSANKKKIYAAFLQNHLVSWLECIFTPGRDERDHGLVSEMYSAGIETLFNLDILRTAEDNKCDRALKDALAEALASFPAVSLDAMPRMFESFIQTIKRHKSALFGQGSNHTAGNVATQVQAVGIAFFSMCGELLASAPNGEDDRIWKTRIALLVIVDAENLYNVRDEHATHTLRQCGEISVEALKTGWQAQRLQQTDASLEVLACLTRIEYDLMSPMLTLIWRRLSLIPDGSSSAFSYLTSLLDFHSKTRTVNVFIDHWLDALSIKSLQTGPADPRIAYQSSSSGVLLCFSLLDRLSKAIHAFLTPGQVPDVVEAIAQKIQDAFKSFRELDKKSTADSGNGARKKRKKDSVGMSLPSVEAPADPEWAAVAFAVMAKAFTLVINSLPLHSVLEDTHQEIRHTVSEAYSSVVPRALKGVFKALSADDRRDTWSWQISAAASLRVHYSLNATSNLNLDLRCAEENNSKMLGAIASEGSLSEFNLEIARVLLSESATGNVDASPIFDALFNYVARHFGNKRIGWTGKSHHLTAENGHGKGAVAIFYLLLTRWLSFFNLEASAEQLTQLVKLMLNASIGDKADWPERTLSAASTVLTTLHNAEFWELGRFRDVFLSRLYEQTASLDSVDLQDSLTSYVNHTARGSVPDTSSLLPAITSTFKTLLHTPEEYLPRGSRAELLKRALAADVTVASYLRNIGGTDGIETRPLLVIREFLRRMLSHTGIVDQMTSYVVFDYFMAAIPANSTPELTSVTLNLIDIYLRSFVKDAEKSSEDNLVKMTKSFATFLNVPLERRLSSHVIHEEALLRFVDTLIPSCESNKLSSMLTSSLRQLHERMVAVYSTQMLSLLSHDILEHSGHPLDSVRLIRAWSRTLALGRALQMHDPKVTKFGRGLVGRLLVNPKLARFVELCRSTLDVLLEELRESAEKEKQVYLEYTVVAYIAGSRAGDTSNATLWNGQLSNACRSLSLVDFSYLLDYVFEALARTGSTNTNDLASLIRLSNLLVHDAPEGTSKSTQAHISRCLNLFANSYEYLSHPLLRRETLDLINSYFNDRPASIKSTDMSSTWSILGYLLAESREHENVTDPTVFHGIIGIINALIRLRRDLILNTLPHLGMILRQLTKCLRALRPHLGAKQTAIVMNTLPKWINSNHPLSAEESKVLARLMTTLTTKTIVRTHGPSGETQKPDSLVRPFSKHAAYVLTAYIEAVNDPLCHVSAQVRKELQPGLFALCDMLGEHIRDAMMVSALDASGKVAMKTLWKDYEKQRYVGKG